MPSSNHVAGSVRLRLSKTDVFGGQVADAASLVMLAVEGVPVVGVESGAEFPTSSRISVERSMRNNKSILEKVYELATCVRNSSSPATSASDAG